MNNHSKPATICNKWGLHARTSFKLAKKAMGFTSDVVIGWEKRKANGKDIGDLLMLGAGFGDTLTVSAKGPDAKNAVDDIVKLIETKFDEPE